MYNRFKRDKTEGRETCQEAAAIDKVRCLSFGTINICNQMILSDLCVCRGGGVCCLQDVLWLFLLLFTR